MATNIMNKNITTISAPVFRSKFQQYITAENREVIEEAFKRFLNMDPDYASYLLWKLTYDAEPNRSLEKLNIFPSDIDLTSDFLSKFRSELRYQYSEAHPNAYEFQENVPESCKRAFNVLKGKADAFVANYILQRIDTWLYSHSVEDAEDALKLLKNTEERKHCGGFKALGFTFKEASFLKDFHLEIHELLAEMFQVHRENHPTLRNTPFEDLAQKIREAGTELPFMFGKSSTEDISTEKKDVTLEVPQEEVIPDVVPESYTSSFKPLTPENVLEFKEVFSVFAVGNDMSCLMEISKLGFDLNQVVSMKEAIKTLLKAAEAFN